jgi:cytochrome P450
LDLVEDIAAPLPIAVIVHLMGLPPEGEGDYRRWAQALILGSTGKSTASDRVRTVSALQELGQQMLELVELRHRAPEEDLVSALVAAEQEHEVMTPPQVVATAAHLLTAGAETTENFLSTFFAELLARPQAAAALRDEPSALPAAIEEVLRYDSPAQLLQRRATKPTKISGEPVPEGTIVILLLGSANRDEARFEHADTLDLRRDASGHLAFGFGSHFCLGAALARLETRLAIEALLPLLPRLELAFDGARRHRSFLSRGYAMLVVHRRA